AILIAGTVGIRVARRRRRYAHVVATHEPVATRGIARTLRIGRAGVRAIAGAAATEKSGEDEPAHGPMVLRRPTPARGACGRVRARRARSCIHGYRARPLAAGPTARDSSHASAA